MLTVQHAGYPAMEANARACPPPLLSELIDRSRREGDAYGWWCDTRMCYITSNGRPSVDYPPATLWHMKAA